MSGKRPAPMRLGIGIACIAAVALLAILAGCSTAPSNGSGESAYTEVDAQFVADNAKSAPAMPLVDVRTAQEFADGHIPGAINIEYSEVMSNDHSQAAALIEMFEKAGIAHDSDVIIYCRTGKRAKSVADILNGAGYSNIYLYTGSWTDWTSDPSRPTEK